MSEPQKQIIAIGGGGIYRDPENLVLDQYIIRQTGAAEPRVAFIPTASGEPDHYVSSFYASFLKLGCRPSVLTFFKRTPDLRAFLLNQDVIYVGGGNTKSMLVIWRDWGLSELLREAWERGIVLTGGSAGAICWFEQGVTDSWAGEFTAARWSWFFARKLLSALRRRSQSSPLVPPALNWRGNFGWSRDRRLDGVHFEGTKLHRVVSSKRGAKAYSLRVVNGFVQEAPLPVDYIA